MPQCFKPSEAGCALAAACRHYNIVVATNIIKPFNPPSCKYSHSIAFGQLPETAAYGPGILRTREHAAVVLCDKRHAVSLKPLKCLAGAKAFQQPLHQPMTTWVDRREVADGGKRVCAVAPSSPRQLHLSEHFVAALKDVHLHLLHHFLEVHGKEEACRTAANYRRSAHLRHPLMKSAAAMRRFPAGCTSTRRSIRSLQHTYRLRPSTTSSPTGAADGLSVSSDL